MQPAAAAGSVVHPQQDEQRGLQTVPAAAAAAAAGHSSPTPEAPSTTCAATPDPRCCRMCLCQGDGDGNPLISACSCSGTIGWCHHRCLQQWRATLWAQGQLARAARCDVCLTPYTLAQHDVDLSWALLDAASDGSSMWQLVQRCAVQLWGSPAAAFRAWRCCILIGGLVRAGWRWCCASTRVLAGFCMHMHHRLMRRSISGAAHRMVDNLLAQSCPTRTPAFASFATVMQACGTRRGMAGLGAGMNAGVKAARPLASLTLRLMPQLSVAAAMLPALAPALRQALRCSCALMAAQVFGGAAAGLFGGGVVGFFLGTVGVLRLSAGASCAAATLATRVAAALSRAAWPWASLPVLLRTVRLPHILAMLITQRRKAAAAAAAAVGG